jgi:hypothetical protein
MKKIIIIIMLIICSMNVLGSPVEDLTQVQEKIMDFFNHEQISIVEGEDVSYSERTLMSMLKKKYPNVKDMKYVSVLDYVEDSSPIVLIGGPNQNSLSKKYLDDSSYSKEEDSLTVGKIIYLTLNEKKIMVFSDYQGFNNIPRTSHKNSPLNNLVPEKLVPITASAMSISLLWLWQLFGKTITKFLKTFFIRKVLKKAKKNKKVKNEHDHLIFDIKIKYREWFSIIGAAVIFSLAISYTYMSNKINTLNLILVTMFANLLIYFVRNIIRLYIDKKHENHTEYNFWIFGSLLTIVSGYLGNTFSLAGFVLTDKKDNAGKTNYIINLVTFLFGIIFLTLNIFVATKFVQMTSFSLISISFLNMIPIEPMGGQNVFKWNKLKWTVLFVPILIVYVFVNLVV